MSVHMNSRFTFMHAYFCEVSRLNFQGLKRLTLTNVHTKRQTDKRIFEKGTKVIEIFRLLIQSYLSIADTCGSAKKCPL